MTARVGRGGMGMGDEVGETVDEAEKEGVTEKEVEGEKEAD